MKALEDEAARLRFMLKQSQNKLFSVEHENERLKIKFEESIRLPVIENKLPSFHASEPMPPPNYMPIDLPEPFSMSLNNALNRISQLSNEVVDLREALSDASDENRKLRGSTMKQSQNDEHLKEAIAYKEIAESQAEAAKRKIERLIQENQEERLQSQQSLREAEIAIEQRFSILLEEERRASEMAQDEIVKLAEFAQAMDGTRQILLDELTRVRLELQMKTSDLQEEEKRRLSLNAELAAIKRDYAAISNVVDTHKRLAVDSERARDDQTLRAKQLEKSTDILKSDLDRAKTQIAELREKSNGWRAQAEALSKERDSLVMQYEGEVRSLRTEVSSLRNDLMETQAERDRTVADLKSAQNEAVSQKMVASNESERVQALTEALREESQAHESLAASLRLAEEERDSYVQELLDLRPHLMSFKERLAQCMDERTQLATAAATIHQQFVASQNKCQTIQNELQRLRDATALASEMHLHASSDSFKNVNQQQINPSVSVSSSVPWPSNINHTDNRNSKINSSNINHINASTGLLTSQNQQQLTVVVDSEIPNCRKEHIEQQAFSNSAKNGEDKVITSTRLVDYNPLSTPNNNSNDKIKLRSSANDIGNTREQQTSSNILRPLEGAKGSNWVGGSDEDANDRIMSEIYSSTSSSSSLSSSSSRENFEEKETSKKLRDLLLEMTNSTSSLSLEN